MIERLSAWKRRNGHPTTEPPINYAAVDENSEAPFDFLHFPAKIKSHNAKLIWEYKDGRISLDELVSDQTLKTLEELTGCNLVKNLNEGKVYIGHSLEEHCQNAVTKLNNIKKYSVSTPLSSFGHMLTSVRDLDGLIRTISFIARIFKTSRSQSIALPTYR